MSKSLNRRNFIGASVASAAALNVGAASFASADEKAKESKSKAKDRCKIGLILYTLRDFLKTPDDIARTLERVKKTGYDAVEITSCEAVSPSELSKILKNCGLQAVSAHTSWDEISKEPQKVIDRNKAIDNDYVVVSYLPDPLQNEEGFKKFAKSMSETGAILAEAGMKLGYHNHSFELAKYNGITGQEILITQSDSRFLNFEIDTYWIQYGGGDPAEWIRFVAGRVPTVHMKDMVTLGKNPAFAEVGEGNLNWEPIIDSCKESGVEYCIVEQDSCQRDPFESIALSVTNMKSWGLR